MSTSLHPSHHGVEARSPMANASLDAPGAGQASSSSLSANSNSIHHHSSHERKNTSILNSEGLPVELPPHTELDHSDFLVDHFEPSHFLLARKHVNLDDLRSELRTYLSGLRVQLHAIINEDYEDFINLGGSNLLGHSTRTTTTTMPPRGNNRRRSVRRITPKPEDAATRLLRQGDGDDDALGTEEEEYDDDVEGEEMQGEEEENQLSYRMRKPIESISREIKSSKSQLEAIRSSLEEKLAKRELIKSRKKICKQLLGVNEQLNKVEEMLVISNPNSNGDATAVSDGYSGAGTTAGGTAGDAGDQATQAGLRAIASAQSRRPSASSSKIDNRSMGSDTKRLERIALEYNQLLYLLRKSAGLRFVENLKPRVDRVSQTLQQDLASLLSSTLASLHATPASSGTRSQAQEQIKRQEALTEIFRTYASIDKFREAEEVIRKQLVVEFLSRTIHREALLGPQSPMMPITPFPAGSSISGTLSGAASDGSFPFNGTPLSGGTSAAIDDRSSIPPFYTIEPIAAPASSSSASRTGDTFISDALVDLYNKVLLFISKEMGVILEITERRPVQGSSSSSFTGKEVSLQSNTFGRDGVLLDHDRTAPSSPSTRDRMLPGSTSSSSSTKAGYEVLSNVLWNEIATRLMNELSHLIFSAGRPDTFHKNYLATLLFVARIESLCPNHRYLMILRNNPNYIALMKRWQLPVYFQLRFKEIVGTLETTLGVNSLTAAPSAVQSTKLLMAASEAIYKAILTCWNPDIYLPDLAGRFWRLTLQLVSRYRTWLDSNLPDSVAGLSASAVIPTSPTSGGAGVNLNRLLPNTLSSAAATSRPSTPGPSRSSSGNDEVSDDNILRQVSIVLFDATKLPDLITAVFESSISSKLPKPSSTSPTSLPVLISQESDEDPVTPESALKAALQDATSIVPALIAQIVTILSKRCSEPLRLVRSGASQVRANPRGLLSGVAGVAGSSNTNPTKIEPSYFVANILRPARLFLDGSGKVLDRVMKESVMNSLFEDLAVRYEAALAKMKKDGDALRRLKKGRQGFQLFGRSSTASSASNDDSGPSAEDEKVRLQMAADIEAFANEAEGLGVDLGNSEALRSLRAVVADWHK